MMHDFPQLGTILSVLTMGGFIIGTIRKNNTDKINDHSLYYVHIMVKNNLNNIYKM